MTYFITDAHPLIWYADESRKLPRKVKKIFDKALTGQVGIWIPTVVLWEISLLEKAGRIRLSKPLESLVTDLLDTSIQLLDLSLPDILEAQALRFSKDPFDTMVVAMASRRNCPLITGDTIIHAQHNCKVVWD